MKILHLCVSAFFIDNYSYQENMMAKYHKKQGHDVTVIASPFTFDSHGKGMYLQEPSSYLDRNSGYRVIRLTYKKPVSINRTFRHYVGLKEAIESVTPDLIFSHGVSFGDATVVVNYLKQHPNVVFYADNHADYVNSAKNWLSKHILHPIFWRHSAKLLEPYMRKCWGVTPLRCDFLKEMYHINPELVEFLPMGVDDESIPRDMDVVKAKTRGELGLSEDDVIAFTGGKIDKLKNIHFLIEAVSHLDHNNLHLVICGTLTQEMEFIKDKIGSNPRIHYLGWCDVEKVMNCMIASDFACFPGTHSTLWEQSVGVGLPIICKRWEGMEHVNVNGNCSFVIGDDVNELKAVISEMLNPDTMHTRKALANEASGSFLYSNISKKAIGY